MKKPKKKSAFERIMTGAKEALAYARGEADPSQFKVHIPKDPGMKVAKRVKIKRQPSKRRAAAPAKQVRS